MNNLKNISIAVWLICVIPAGTVFAQMPVSRVVVAQAESQEAPATIVLVGIVNPLHRSRVSCEIGGLVKAVPVREGAAPEAGTVLCELNSDTLTLRLAEEQARLAALKSRHEELLAGTRPEEIVRLKALLEEAVAEFDQWDFELQRIEKLFAARSSNEKEINDTRSAHRRAGRRRIAAQAAYDLAVAGPRKEVIAQAAHEVARQQAVVEQVRSNLSKTRIRAPFSGSVVARLTEVGEWLDPGDPVAEMVDLHKVLVRVDAPESALPHVQVGDGARVYLDALKRSFQGSVKHIMRQADPSAHTFPVDVELDNPEGLLAAGMFARVTLPSGPAQESVVVPKDAVIEKNGVRYVGIVMPGREGGMNGMLIPVTIGAEGDDWMAITSGNIRPGQQVIQRGNERMMPFPAPVEIVDEFGSPVALPTEAARNPREGSG